MFYLNSLIAFLSVAVHIDADSIDCNSPPNITQPFLCCDLPKLFTDADKEECHFNIDPEKRMDIYRGGNAMCDPVICLLKKNNIMVDDHEVDVDAFKDFLKKFGETDKEWSDVVSVVIENCFGHELDKVAPSNWCGPLRHFYCMEIKTYLGCPESRWNATDNCKKVASYFADCIDTSNL